MIRPPELKAMLEKLYTEGMLVRPLNQALDFPVGELPPFLYQVVNDVTAQSMAPASSTVCIMFCALSACLQGVVRVQKRPGMISHVGMAMIVSLPSGERKSSSAKLLFSGIRDYDSEEYVRTKQESDGLPIKREVWHAFKRGLLNAIQRALKEGSDIQALEAKLTEHILSEPRKGPVFRALFEKASIAALSKHLAENVPVTTLFSDEALVQLAGSSSQDFGFLNRLLDGDKLTADFHGNSIQIDLPALTFGLLGQNEVINKFLFGKKSLARDSGFIARCFYIKPNPTSGSRYLELQGAVEKFEALDVFNIFCRHCLDLTKSIAAGGGRRKILEFSPEASVLWCKYYNDIECEIAQRGQASLFPDLSSKQADKVARIAAIFHCVQSDDDYISYDSMHRAINIGEWLFRQTIYCMSNQKGDELAQRAQMLFNWLVRHLSATNQEFISKTALMQVCPNELRGKENLQPVLDWLESLGQIRMGRVVDRGKTVYVGLMQPAQQVMR